MVNIPKKGELVYVGFFAGLGSLAAFMILTVVALVFFVPGFILLKKEQSKPKEEQKQSTKVLAYVLMGIGMIVGVGFGAGTFFGELGGEF